MWWFIYCVPLFHCWTDLYVGDFCSTVGVILNYLLLFSESLFILFLPHFAGWMCICLFIVSMWCPSLSLILLFAESQTPLLWLHDVKGEGNDSSSLEQDRPRNNPISSLLFCVLSVFCCSSGLTPSPHPAAPSSAVFVSLSAFPQILTLWGSTALTMPWSEEWWL